MFLCRLMKYELHAARELYSDALQGNVNYDAAEVLQWLKSRFEPWFNNYSQSTVEGKHSGEPPPVTGTRSSRERGATSLETSLTQEQLGEVFGHVRQRMLVDINEVLTTLGDRSLRAAVLQAVECSPHIKAHPGPQTICLQWRMVA